MSSKNRGTINFHIGANGVASGRISNILKMGINRFTQDKYTIIEEDEFSKNLRDAISNNRKDVISQYFASINASQDKIVLSRPSFLYGGVPLNMPGSFEKNLYKMKVFQDALRDYRVVFHFFIESHTSYLARHVGYLEKSTPHNITPSWIYIAQAMGGIIEPGNRLHMWNAESKEQLYAEFVDAIDEGLWVNFDDIESFESKEIRLDHVDSSLFKGSLDRGLLSESFELDLDVLSMGGSE